MLMALLFVGGIMNLLWIVGLTLIVTVEKLAPRGDLFGKVAGVALFAWGVVMLAR
jgi:predicted metal-binding membrane protein